MPTAPIVTDASGKQKYVWDVQLQFDYPFDPESPVFILAAPPGGIGVGNVPFLVKGDPGMPSLMSSKIDYRFLQPDDPTPDSAELVELTPGSTTQSQVSQLRLTMHLPRQGKDGAAVLNPSDYGTPLPKRMLVVNSTANGFVYQQQLAGARQWPTAITEAGSGTTAGFTLTTISIPANTYSFPYQVEVDGSTMVTGSGPDVRVDLVARLGSETGPVLGRCYGVGGVKDRLQLVDGPDTNASAASVTVAANAGVVVYLRTEKQAGADTYSTGAVPTRFCVKVRAVP